LSGPLSEAGPRPATFRARRPTSPAAGEERALALVPRASPRRPRTGTSLLDGWFRRRPPADPRSVPAAVPYVVLLNTDIDHKGSEPSTLFGDAITKIVTAQHVFDLPAQPAAH
jgi:hypothetical protein